MSDTSCDFLRPLSNAQRVKSFQCSPFSMNSPCALSSHLADVYNPADYVFAPFILLHNSVLHLWSGYDGATISACSLSALRGNCVCSVSAL